MKLASIWNDRWARIAALIAFGSVAVGLAVEAAPAMRRIFDAIKPMDTLLGVFVVATFFAVVVFAIVLLFPAWWPLWRARRAGLPDPWVFAMVIWGVSTVALDTLAALVMFPLMAYQVFIVPDAKAYDLASKGFAAAMYVANEYGWIALFVLQSIAAVVITRVLARRWRGIANVVRAPLQE